MITLKDLLGHTDFESLPPDHRQNLLILMDRTNQVRAKFGKSPKVDSGYRLMADHIRIYREKGITDPSKIPMKSKHLIGAAEDDSDPKKELQAWVIQNEELVASIGLWCEGFRYTPTWVHFQCLPYASWVPGKSIFFIP